MNARKFIALLMAALMVAAMFTGCGAAKENAAYDGYTGGTGDMQVSATESNKLTDPGQPAETNVPQNQKLIRKIWLEAETEDMDSLLVSVEKQITKLGGYVESREIRNGSRYDGYTHRYGSLTIRIPADQLDGFTEAVSEQANIVSKRETAEDVTLTYVATESRLKMLQTEQERLLELLRQAKNMEEILQIEERLMDVRTELEQVASQMRILENQVSYGTVYLDIAEVREYTEIREEPEGFFARIGTGFMKSLKNLGIFFKELAIFLIVAIPYLIPIAVVVVALVLLIKRRMRKKAKKTESAPEKPAEETEE